MAARRRAVHKVEATNEWWLEARIVELSRWLEMHRSSLNRIRAAQAAGISREMLDRTLEDIGIVNRRPMVGVTYVGELVQLQRHRVQSRVVYKADFIKLEEALHSLGLYLGMKIPTWRRPL